jgi:Transposase DDE domain
MRHSTPFFPSWQHRLAALGRRSAGAARHLRQATLAQIEERFAPALPASLLGQNLKKDHSRERIFTLARTLWCWIWQILQAQSSCREVVRQVQALFALHQAGAVDEGSGAYCEARRKLSDGLLEKVFFQSFRSAEQAAPSPVQALLQNRPVRVVDGSGARLPDTPKNRAAFPPSANLPAHTGFPYLRIVALFSLASGALLAQATGSLHSSELRLLVEGLLSHLSCGDILLGDRTYGNYVLAALLQAARIDLISTICARSRRVDFRRAQKRLGPGDAHFLWKKPSKASPLLCAQQWQALPKEITVRVLRVRLERRGFRTEEFHIVTTLLDAGLYPAAQIIAAHARRWRMEMCLDDLKTTLGMEQLRCLSPVMVKKELLVFLTTHNLIRWLMAEAAREGQVEMEWLSFKGSLDGFRQWSQAMVQRRQRHQRAELWRQLLRIIVADALPNRPGRHEPRAVKKRSKYPHLNKPRRKYVGRWGRNKRARAARAKRKASLN